MKLLIVTQKVDQNDPILGFFCRWIIEFARRLSKEAKEASVTVICLSEGQYEWPEDVRTKIKVLSLGKGGGGSGGSRLRYVLRFFSCIWKERQNYDAVFVHMNPEYIVLAGWLWRLLSKPVYLWYVHRSVTWHLRVAHLFVHGVFSSVPESFRIKSDKAVFVGHAIPLDLFARPADFHLSHGSNNLSNLSHATSVEPFEVLSVGRITPIKRFEILIDAAGILRDRREGGDKGVSIHVSIVGETVFPKDKVYLEMLHQKIAAQKLEDVITFVPAVQNTAIAKWYWKSDLMVNLSPTGGLDKVVLEAMASGTPIITTNDAFRPYFGSFAEDLIVMTEGRDGDRESPQSAAQVADAILHLACNPEIRKTIAAHLQNEAHRFDLPLTISKIIEKMLVL